MITISAEQLSPRDNYRILIGSIIPRPIAFVTTLSEAGVLNGAPFSFFNVISSKPPLLGISVQRNRGEQKDTARNAIHQKAFVVHVVDESNVAKINETAATVSSETSEIDLAGLTPVESTSIHVPGVAEAKIRMECVLDQALPLGDNSCDLLIGRVVQYHFHPDVYDEATGHIDPRALSAYSRLAGNDYATIGDIITIERPK